jgi:hypothetical protein
MKDREGREIMKEREIGKRENERGEEKKRA